MFGVNRPSATANPFNNWLLAPGNVYLSGYGQNATAATALQCTNTVAAQNPLLPAPSCDPSLLTQFEYVGPGSNHPNHQAIANYWGGFGPAIGLAWQIPWVRRRKNDRARRFRKNVRDRFAQRNDNRECDRKHSRFKPSRGVEYREFPISG